MICFRMVGIVGVVCVGEILSSFWFGDVMVVVFVILMFVSGSSCV